VRKSTLFERQSLQSPVSMCPLCAPILFLTKWETGGNWGQTGGGVHPKTETWKMVTVLEYGDFRDEESADKYEGFLIVASSKGDTLFLFEPKG